MRKLCRGVIAFLVRTLVLVLFTSSTLFSVAHAAQDPDVAKPVLELLLDGSLNDSSDSKQTCTPHGAIAFVDGRRGKCVSLDGQSWIDTGLSQEALGTEFTVECWVNPAGNQNAYADVFGNHLGEGAGFVLQQDGANTNQFLGAYGYGQGQWVLTNAVPFAADRWQHVALVKTQEALRFYLNGILVAETQDSAPAVPSSMPVALGLGYNDRGRCFRGSIDDFRIWNKVLTQFSHAGIDADAARETRTQYIDATPRPAVGAMSKSWTLTTEDTRLSLGVTAGGEIVIDELSCPTANWNWITNPVPFGFWPYAEADGQSRALQWQFVDGTMEKTEGQKLTLRFACDEPELEITSVWHARPGPGPIHHSTSLRNRSSEPVTIGEQPTFDLDLTGAAALWRFHSDGGTPDPVGVYRHSLTTVEAGRRYVARTTPDGEFIPYVLLESAQRHGVYMGLEWSFCRIEAITLAERASPTVRVRAGNIADLLTELAPGETLLVRPGFLGAYSGDLDDAGNRLRRWLFRYNVPEVLRQDPGYPKVQWNAFGATGKEPGSWDPIEKGYYPLIDDIAPLGFEEVMIDVGWWQGDEPDFDQTDWPSGMRKASDYAHERGMRFGLYWTDPLDMANAKTRGQRADRVRRLFEEYDADMWRSDCTRGAVVSASYAATLGFYQMVDALAREVSGFQWENCCGGGRIKDYGAMKRAIKIFNSDTYSALHVRQAFYDSSYAFHPAQLEGHLGSTDGRYRPRGVADVRYAFRSSSMGAPEWFLDAPSGCNGSEPWTREEKGALQACVDTYKSKVRPLVREADLYHIFPRPDGRRRDGIEYYDSVRRTGVVYLFQPSREALNEVVRFKGLEPSLTYRVHFEDGTNPTSLKSGAELMEGGVHVRLEGEEVSELILFEATQ